MSETPFWNQERREALVEFVVSVQEEAKNQRWTKKSLRHQQNSLKRLGLNTVEASWIIGKLG